MSVSSFCLRLYGDYLDNRLCSSRPDYDALNVDFMGNTISLTSKMTSSAASDWECLPKPIERFEIYASAPRQSEPSIPSLVRFMSSNDCHSFLSMFRSDAHASSPVYTTRASYHLITKSSDPADTPGTLLARRANHTTIPRSAVEIAESQRL